MTEPTVPEPDQTSEPAPEASGTTDDGEAALGQTSDADGAEREEPAGQDYAGSGF
ncbi:MAG: hypothetical protein ACLGIF_04930 [Actinomycetes bacterium]